MVASAIGDEKLTPRYPDCSCTVINTKSGYSRGSNSWVLGRLMRDYLEWMDDEVRKSVNDRMELTRKDGDPRPPIASPCVAIYSPRQGQQGVPTCDLVSWSGLITVFVQFCLTTYCSIPRLAATFHHIYGKRPRLAAADDPPMDQRVVVMP
jgi:hypothetical protein